MTTRDAYLRRTYGITQREYDALLKAQRGVCGVCKREPKPGVNFHVDHEHVRGWRTLPPETKRQFVRGLLCWHCNQYRIAQLTAALASAAFLYLTDPPARKVLRDR
jgi:hypothetical protein